MTTTEFLEREIRRAEISLRHAQRKPNTPEEELRELVEADSDGRCMVFPFKPNKVMWSCSKSNPKPAKAYYATEMGILADMKAGCVFGETAEAAEAALAKEEP